MYSYGYFTAPINDNVHEFCKKCTPSYGCVCELLVQQGHCPTCMDPPAPGPQRVDAVAQYAKEMREQLREWREDNSRYSFMHFVVHSFSYLLQELSFARAVGIRLKP